MKTHFARVARCIIISLLAFFSAQLGETLFTAKTVHVKNTAHNFSTYLFFLAVKEGYSGSFIFEIIPNLSLCD